tara:strand:+ start:876 stop:1163 length:288 start_codon:yes stop_codon:yes gene_type:complete
MKHFKNFTKTETAVFKVAVLYAIAAICFLCIAFSCTTSRDLNNVDLCPKWADNIKNPENLEFIEEVAFNLDKPVSQISQKEFNDRYLRGVPKKTN